MASGLDTEPSPAELILQRSVERGRVGHAYLFSGESISELETLARSLAKALNCASPESRAKAGLSSCGQCSNCRRIEQFNQQPAFLFGDSLVLPLIHPLLESSGILKIEDISHSALM